MFRSVTHFEVRKFQNAFFFVISHLCRISILLIADTGVLTEKRNHVERNVLLPLEILKLLQIQAIRNA